MATVENDKIRNREPFLVSGFRGRQKKRETRIYLAFVGCYETAKSSVRCYFLFINSFNDSLFLDGGRNCAEQGSMILTVCGAQRPHERESDCENMQIMKSALNMLLRCLEFIFVSVLLNNIVGQ